MTLLLLLLIWGIGWLVKLVRKWLSRPMKKIFPNDSDFQNSVKTNIFTILTPILLTELYFYIGFKFIQNISFLSIGITIMSVEVPVLVYYCLVDLIEFVMQSIKQRKGKNNG